MQTYRPTEIKLKLVVATPSPYARKARVALLEKNIPFETVIENPWVPETCIGNVNPLGKVPALILDNGEVVHDSSVIAEYVDTFAEPPRLLPIDPLLRVAVKQIEAIADGVCDAVVLILLERYRRSEIQSEAWMSRQRKKVDAGVEELSQRLGEKEFFTAAGFSLAEISTACTLGYLDMRFPEFDWRAGHGNLQRLFQKMSARPSFAQTIPSPQFVPQDF